MNWFKNQKIRTKLTLTFGLLALLTATVGFLGIRSLNESTNNSKTIYTNMVKPISLIGHISASFQRVRLETRDLLLSETQDEVDSNIRTLNNHMEEIDIESEKFEQLILTAETKNHFDEFRSGLDVYKADLNKLMLFAKNNQDREGFDYLNNKMKKLSDKIIESINALDIVKLDHAEAKQQASIKMADTANLIMIIVVSLAILLAISIGYYVSKLISEPIVVVSKRLNQLEGLCITNLGNGLNSLAKGNVNYIAETGTPFLNMDGNDEIGELSKSVDGIIRRTQASVDAYEQSRNTLKGVVSEISGLIESSKEGDLGKRGNSENFEGTYKDLLDGFNMTLESVVTPINESRDVLEQMAIGDFTIRINGNYRGDYKILKDSVNKLGDSMCDAFEQVNEAIQATASASAQISSSSEEMAAGAQEQSSQTAEIASAIEQMAKTIVETTRNAGKAASNAKHAGDTAFEGGNVVKETVNGMSTIAKVVKNAALTVKELGASSEQIGSIIQVIDDIADQTNLLALNAAIEAARAGEQGRGFAVVADEVRKLAERTTKATKEIGSMINKIQLDTGEAVKSMDQGTKEVETGMMLAEKSGKSLEEIINGVKNVDSIIGQVAAASEEQSSSAEQISRSIEGINGVTQEAAAGVQQIARASEDLNRLTNNLQNLVERFNIVRKTNSKVKELGYDSSNYEINSNYTLIAQN